jgi:hypothetical protein
LLPLEDKSNKNDDKVRKFNKILLDYFTIPEMVEILEKPTSIVGKAFSKKLTEKGIKIPHSPEKLDQFLEQHSK